MRIEEECADAIRDEMLDAMDGGRCYAEATIYTDDGFAEVSTDSNDNVFVMIVHDNGNRHRCSNLCDKIAKAIPKWDDVAEQRAERMEDSEEGYNDLDPAFSSWTDFWNYKGF